MESKSINRIEDGVIVDRSEIYKKIVGAKQVIKHIKSKAAAKVYVAKDADTHITQQIIDLCTENDIEIIYFETMKELGNFCEIDVGASTACLVNK